MVLETQATSVERSFFLNAVQKYVANIAVGASATLGPRNPEGVEEDSLP